MSLMNTNYHLKGSQEQLFGILNVLNRHKCLSLSKTLATEAHTPLKMAEKLKLLS